MSHSVQQSDKIHIQDLQLFCRIGVTTQERHRPQAILANLTLFTDLLAASQSDDLRQTVDYDTVSRILQKIAEESSCALLERLATLLMAACFEFPAITGLTLRLDKPSAIASARSAGIEVTRWRNQ